MLSTFKKNFNWLVLFLVFLLGGTGFYLPWAALLGLSVSILGLILILIKKKNVKLPPYWRLFAIFIGFCLLSFIWSVDKIQSYNIFLLILSGFGFLIFSYNLDIRFRKFEKLLIVLGLVFSLIFIINVFLLQPIIDSLSLPFYSVVSKNHTHIGDYWVIIALISIYKLLKNRQKTLYWLLLGCSIIMLAASLSRASYIALLIGIFFVSFKEKFLDKKKIVFYGISILLMALFLGVATQKSLVSSRPYFVQSLVGLIKYPFGVGLGNFGFISKDTYTHIWGASSFSFYSHNIILEFLSGIGIFSMSFIFWFYKILKDTIFLKQKNYLLSSIIIALTVNFFFDYTYFIPTMLWIWFSCIGFFQSQVKIKK